MFESNKTAKEEGEVYVAAQYVADVIVAERLKIKGWRTTPGEDSLHFAIGMLMVQQSLATGYALNKQQAEMEKAQGERFAAMTKTFGQMLDQFEERLATLERKLNQ